MSSENGSCGDDVASYYFSHFLFLMFNFAALLGHVKPQYLKNFIYKLLMSDSFLSL